MATPTKRTLDYLRDIGHTAGVVERWCPHSKKRHDLYGFIDVLSVNGNRVCGWQATSGDHVAERIKKITSHDLFPAVAQAMSIYVIGWRKHKKPVDGKWWRPRIVPVDAP